MFDYPRVVEVSTPSTDFEKFHDLSTAAFWERPSVARHTLLWVPELQGLPKACEGSMDS